MIAMLHPLFKNVKENGKEFIFVLGKKISAVITTEQRQPAVLQCINTRNLHFNSIVHLPQQIKRWGVAMFFSGQEIRPPQFQATCKPSHTATTLLWLSPTTTVTFWLLWKGMASPRQSAHFPALRPLWCAIFDGLPAAICVGGPTPQHWANRSGTGGQETPADQIPVAAWGRRMVSYDGGCPGSLHLVPGCHPAPHALWPWCVPGTASLCAREGDCPVFPNPSCKFPYAQYNFFCHWPTKKVKKGAIVLRRKLFKFLMPETSPPLCAIPSPVAVLNSLDLQQCHTAFFHLCILRVAVAPGCTGGEVQTTTAVGIHQWMSLAMIFV